MKPAHATALLFAASALLLSACDIPATGVVEAGGPASGIPPTVPVYLIRDGALVAVSRTISDAGEPVTAVESLLQGPTPQERRERLTTALAVQPTPLRPTPSPTEPLPDEAVRLTAQNNAVHVELPSYAGDLTRLAADQVICTAARAYLLTREDLESTTVTVTDATGEVVVGGVERCPEL
ncbi:hypothetical protein HLK59_49985 [Streptomyces sp. S3(2020)]|uniref:hypothetical protein n=1 Tax=Streptomyces sp. S3(2020) TaxID=2732044 RepID=UPI0014889164|nr:hypothetical protein [Streptomyces sp. S3(2020)]NNN38286.1 hypothetical protein [Streptomyces sp. S3(2020)]